MSFDKIYDTAKVFLKLHRILMFSSKQQLFDDEWSMLKCWQTRPFVQFNRNKDFQGLFHHKHFLMLKKKLNIIVWISRCVLFSHIVAIISSLWQFYYWFCPSVYWSCECLLVNCNNVVICYCKSWLNTGFYGHFWSLLPRWSCRFCR